MKTSYSVSMVSRQIYVGWHNLLWKHICILLKSATFFFFSQVLVTVLLCARMPDNWQHFSQGYCSQHCAIEIVSLDRSARWE